MREDPSVRAVIQRVSSAKVEVDGEVVGEIDGPGLVILLAVTHSDGGDQVAWLSSKIAGLRIFEGELSLLELNAPALVVSQFTLYADVRKGRRPSWSAAAPGPVSEPLYERFCEALEALGVRVSRGVFGADMAVSLVNDGPITLIVDTPT